VPIYELDGKRPRIHPEAWIAPTATVIGNVEVRRGASVWFGAILRGDENEIVVGEEANVQDGTMIHCSDELPTVIGAHASIGHLCCLEGCVLDEWALVGTGSTVLQRARVGKRALLAAGSVLAEGVEVPDGHLAAGVPAVVKKELAGSSLRWITRPGPHYVAQARLFRERLRLIEPD
jgi:carbonic anhydrase/acetyltransferase-like protein (isoleucine patch superfamily)